ncbi:predicted protein [Verticillium alfalfae VaMs.102]|uniref:Predicted protein n=1 Tax=Verticillium alfalfae (strain VaMs.102 / ATCC MYA-4576 / FGSC 10136) TaxID=526221 RepID=C9SBP5_VERA1|nr:predicted protein [Verticillium alfalfae VaMs.102]EEY15779.1 predicted protein [Verticillium alfalfae VaMs.102]
MAGEQEQAQEAAAAQKASATQKSDPDPELEPVATSAVANGSAGAPKKKKKEALKPIITTETPQKRHERRYWGRNTGLAVQAGCCGQAKRRAGDSNSTHASAAQTYQNRSEARPDHHQRLAGGTQAAAHAASCPVACTSQGGRRLFLSSLLLPLSSTSP